MRPGVSIYAISDSSSVFHLLYTDQNYTLCGVRAAKHDPQMPKGGLYVVEIVPPNRELCKQCEKMKKRREAVADNQNGQSGNPKDSVIQESSRPGDAF